MASLSEDELLQALTWSDDSYCLSEFVNEFPLPQVVKVVRGHDGGTESSTIGYGEVLTLHALRETKVLAAEDRNDNAISVSLDFPREFQILPQTTDCSLNSCGVTDLPSFYETIKYIEVIEAHYGTDDNVDSTDQGELLEIIDIHKPNKPEKAKVQVRNLETGHKLTLTSTCTARFRPLLDWKRYKALDLKARQHGFPVRIRFLEVEDGVDEDDEFQRFIARSPDINVTAETEDVIVISTIVENDPDLKFCYEIPKNVGIKVAVAEGFLTGAKHYTDIVNNLNERFDVTKFMASHQPALLARRDRIKQHDYDAIKKYIINKSMGIPQFDEYVKQDPGAPALPPRRPVGQTKSLDLPGTPPVVPKKPFGRKGSDSSDGTNSRRPKPAVRPRDRSSSQTSDLKVRDSTALVPEVQGDIPVASPGTSINSLPNSPPPPVEAKPQIKSPKPTPPSRKDSQLNKIDESSQAKSDTPLATSNAEPAKETNTPAMYQNIPQSTGSYPSPQVKESDFKPQVKSPKLPPRHPKVPDGATSTPVASSNVPQNSNDHPNYPSQFKDDNATKKPTQVKSPKLPPRHSDVPDGTTYTPVASPNVPQNPNDRNYPSQFEDDNATKGPNEAKLTADEDNDYLVPVLPPKSPPEWRKITGNPWKVLPVNPNVPGHPQSETRSLKPPYTPPCTRAPKGRGIQRVGTLPKHFKFGGYSGQDEASQNVPEGDDLYEELTDITPTKVMPVAPQRITRAERFVQEENPYELVAKIPQDLSGLSVGQVSAILRNLNMAEYAERFEDEMIDGNLLKELKESDLESFQMTNIHRTKLLKFVKGWRPTYHSKQQNS